MQRSYKYNKLGSVVGLGSEERVESSYGNDMQMTSYRKMCVMMMLSKLKNERSKMGSIAKVHFITRIVIEN